MAFNLLNLLRSILFTEASSTAKRTSKQTSFQPTMAYLLEREAIVEQTIQPYRAGRVYFRGSWWNARCEQAITINPGETVYVVGMTGITLLVQSTDSSELSQNYDPKIELLIL